MNTRNNKDTSEETFLKNRAKRVSSETKHELKKKKAKKKASSKKASSETRTDKKSTAIKIACITLCVLVAICIVIVGSWIYFATKKPDAHISNDGAGLSGADSTFETIGGEKASLSENVYSFLATGTDKSGGLTDVIIVGNYDINTQSVSLLQIPRDTYVKVSSKLHYDEKGNLSKENYTTGYGIKINSAYSHARSLAESAIENLLSDAKGKSADEIKKLVKSDDYLFLGADAGKVLSHAHSSDSKEKTKLFTDIKRDFGIKYLSTLIYYNFGIPVDYHAQVNLSGFRGIVDAIGGVEMYVPQDMYYNDPYQDLYIDIKQGQQVLDGETAEDFVRFRSGYAMADIARLDAQKMFMTAFLKKLFSPSSIPKIGNIITEIQKNLYTNLPLDDTIYFANKALGIDLSSGITMTTLPGVVADGTPYYSANKKAVMELVNSSFNKYDTALPEDRFLLIEVSSKPASVTTSTVGDIENNSPDLGFLPEDSQHDLEGVDDDSSVDIDGEITEDTENPEYSEDIENIGENGEDSAGTEESPETDDDESNGAEDDGGLVNDTEDSDGGDVNTSEDGQENESGEPSQEETPNTEIGEDNSVSGESENGGEESGSAAEKPIQDADANETGSAPEADAEGTGEDTPSDNSHLLENFIH